LRAVTSLPYAITETDHVRIPVSDGAVLSARIWRPVSSDTDPVPAILEYIPYRKGDLTAPRDSIHHPYLAGHGYACVRVDIRGTGESEGVLADEYLEREQLDAEDVLEWIAGQPWCTGGTGMMGISWGAFAALQVAARKPPSLRAIVISSFTDDRFADDMHYMGGCLPVTALTPGEQRWTASRDLVDYHPALDIVKNAGTVRFAELDLEVSRDVRERYSWGPTTSARRSPKPSGSSPSPAVSGRRAARPRTGCPARTPSS
jgi:putative CocE/NonD family hydrolase